MTINLEQARKLQELGVTKTARMAYHHTELPDTSFLIAVSGGATSYDNTEMSYAYNAEELIKLLRAKEHIQIEIYSHGDGFMFHHEGTDDIYGDSITECLANKLIYDLENGITTVEEINHA